MLKPVYSIVPQHRCGWGLAVNVGGLSELTGPAGEFARIHTHTSHVTGNPCSVLQDQKGVSRSSSFWDASCLQKALPPLKVHDAPPCTPPRRVGRQAGGHRLWPALSVCRLHSANGVTPCIAPRSGLGVRYNVGMWRSSQHVAAEPTNVLCSPPTIAGRLCKTL